MNHYILKQTVVSKIEFVSRKSFFGTEFSFLVDMTGGGQKVVSGVTVVHAAVLAF